MTGGTGNDTIRGAQNDTLLNGGGGTDTLDVNANFTSSGDGQITNIENVTLLAASTLNLSNQTEGFTITGSSGIDSITGGSANDIIIGAANDTLLNGGANVAGGMGDVLQLGANFTSSSDGQITNVETILLTAGGTTLNLSNQGEGFNINGSSGADTVVGSTAGGDIINGQGGNDTLTGGNGAGVDQFRFFTSSGNDTVTDFTVGTDRIGFAGAGATGGVAFNTVVLSPTGTNLAATDFATVATIQNIGNNDDNQVDVITSTQTSAQIAAAVGNNIINLYVVVFNSTTNRAEIWFDTNWDDTANRTQIATLAGVTAAQVAAMTASNFVVYNNTLGPAGAAGSAIDLNLENASNLVAGVSTTISGLPQGWVLSSGVDNGNGTWTVDYSALTNLTATSPSGSTSATLLTVSQTWTNADGSTGTAMVEDNVVAYASGTPIFAWAADDTLTGSANADLFVFSQPIGADAIRNFDATADRIDLVGYAGVDDFTDLSISDTASGALIDLGNGQSILVDGVSMSSLTAANFQFNVSPTITNAGTITVGNGAVLPISGTIDNSGTISLQSTGATTVLQLIQYGITLQGGGNLVLSDSASNVISGTVSTVTFNNVDNVISGAGQLGGGSLMLINGGTIVADGGNALVIDTGANAITNTGTIQATGLGGLEIVGSIVNSGTLLTNGSSILDRWQLNRQR